MNAPLDFYFEFASPYGYLASTQIDALAARHGRTVAWHPIMLGAAFKATGARPLMQTPLKGPYLLHDVPRFARLLGVPLTLPPVMPMNSLAASRACVWLAEEDDERARRLARALFHAHWGEGRDLAAPEAVADVAQRARHSARRPARGRGRPAHQGPAEGADPGRDRARRVRLALHLRRRRAVLGRRSPAQIDAWLSKAGGDKDANGSHSAMPAMPGHM